MGAIKTRRAKVGSGVELNGAAAPVAVAAPVEYLDGPIALPVELRGSRRPCQVHPLEALAGHDPVTDPRPGLITKSTRVASIGSCFSRRIKEWLVGNGYRYLQVENGPGTEDGSARYGRIYTTASLRQTLERMTGEFDPVERWWKVGGRLVDPYRTRLVWKDEEAAEAELAAHARAMWELVETCDVMIVTLGLTELWRRREDRAAFWVFPLAGFDARVHEFVALSVEECIADLEKFYETVQGANAKLQVVVTLSPIPLHVTFREAADCVVADSVGKATLRVAIDEFCRRHPEVVYFPAYEVVRVIEPGAWEEDHRHVTAGAVDRIMRLFMRHYGD